MKKSTPRASTSSGHRPLNAARAKTTANKKVTRKSAGGPSETAGRSGSVVRRRTTANCIACTRVINAPFSAKRVCCVCKIKGTPSAQFTVVKDDNTQTTGAMVYPSTVKTVHVQDQKASSPSASSSSSTSSSSDSSHSKNDTHKQIQITEYRLPTAEQAAVHTVTNRQEVTPARTHSDIRQDSRVRKSFSSSSEEDTQPKSADDHTKQTRTVTPVQSPRLHPSMPKDQILVESKPKPLTFGCEETITTTKLTRQRNDGVKTNTLKVVKVENEQEIRLESHNLPQSFSLSNLSLHSMDLPPAVELPSSPKVQRTHSSINREITQTNISQEMTQPGINQGKEDKCCKSLCCFKKEKLAAGSSSQEKQKKKKSSCCKKNDGDNSKICCCCCRLLCCRKKSDQPKPPPAHSKPSKASLCCRKAASDTEVQRKGRSGSKSRGSSCCPCCRKKSAEAQPRHAANRSAHSAERRPSPFSEMLARNSPGGQSRQFSTTRSSRSQEKSCSPCYRKKADDTQPQKSKHSCCSCFCCKKKDVPRSRDPSADRQREESRGRTKRRRFPCCCCKSSGDSRSVSASPHRARSPQRTADSAYEQDVQRAHQGKAGARVSINAPEPTPRQDTKASGRKCPLRFLFCCFNSKKKKQKKTKSAAGSRKAKSSCCHRKASASKSHDYEHPQPVIPMGPLPSRSSVVDSGQQTSLPDIKENGEIIEIEKYHESGYCVTKILTTDRQVTESNLLNQLA